MTLRSVRRAARIAGILLIAACAGPGGDTIVVAAASDLAGAMPELSAVFEAESGVSVSVTLGSSGMLAQQVVNGAPVDVFMSADHSWTDRLVADGHADGATRTRYARGVLTLVTAAHAAPAADVAALANARYARIALANPQHAPYGRAARQALERAGVWSLVEPRLILSENVRQAYEYVASGNVDAALVARALVPASARWVDVPVALHDPLQQEAVMPIRAPDPAMARQFLAFLVSDAARGILLRHHFILPDP